MEHVRATYELLSINTILLICMFILTMPLRLYCNPRVGQYKSKNFNSFFFIFYLFCVCSFFNEDTYTTWNDFLYSKKSVNLVYYEPIYRWLAGLVEMKYFLWRAVVWGVAVGSMYSLVRLLRDNSMALMFSVVLLLPMSYFVATRGSSAHALALIGVSLMLGEKGLYKKNILISIIFIFLSLTLHRSNFLFLALIICSLIIPIQKKSWIMISLILYPFLTIVITNIINSFVTGGFELAFGDGMNVQGQAMFYASSESSERNANGILRLIIIRAPYVLITVYLVSRICFSNISLPKIYYFYFKATYICVYTSLLFAFINTSSWLFERIMFMGLFPMTLIYSKVLQKESRNSKLYKITVASSLLSILFTVSYYWYKY